MMMMRLSSQEAVTTRLEKRFETPAGDNHTVQIKSFIIFVHIAIISIYTNSPQIIAAMVHSYIGAASWAC